MEPKTIHMIQQGVWEGHVLMRFTATDGQQTSYRLLPSLARQVLTGLQTLLESLEAGPPGTQDGVGMQEQVTVRLV
jgi:hypothetical protein